MDNTKFFSLKDMFFKVIIFTVNICFSGGLFMRRN